LRRAKGREVITHVIQCNEKFDLAILEPEDSSILSQFLILESVSQHVSIEEFTLATLHVGLSKEHREDGLEFEVGIAYHNASVLRTTPHHLSYEAMSFDGDSGGALVLRRNGHVVGMHLSTVNRARELKRHKEVDDRLEDIEESVDTLIKGTAVACLALRLDAFPSLTN